MNEQRVLGISWGTIVKVLLAILGFYLLYLIRDILIWCIFALIISILFDPAITFLQRRKIPRTLAVIFVYVVIFSVLSIVIYLTAPLFVQETHHFLKSLPQYFEKVSPPLKGLGFRAFENLESFVTAFGRTLEGMASSIFNALFAIFGGIVSTTFVITISIFLSLEDRPIEKTLALLFPKKHESRAMSIWQRCQRKVAGWFGARVLACLFVGVISYIAFLLFNVKYPFALGLLAGVFNFIPLLGPLITGFLIFLIVYLESVLKAIFVLLAFVLIQQIENNILSPVLTKKFIGLPAVLVLIALVVGGKLWGLLGAILAIPLVGILFEFLRDFLKRRKAVGQAEEGVQITD